MAGRPIGGMMMVEYTTVKGLTQYKPEMGIDIEMGDVEDSMGWCLGCGELVGGCEPDARKCVCGCCGKSKVYGLEELLLMNLVA